MVKNITQRIKLKTGIRKSRTTGKKIIKNTRRRFKTAIDKLPETLGLDKRVGVGL